MTLVNLRFPGMKFLVIYTSPTCPWPVDSSTWRLSNTLEACFCAEALEEALTRGKPEVFNTDQ